MRYLDKVLIYNDALLYNQDPKRSGHRGFGFVTFAEDGVAERVSRRTHEILGQEVLNSMLMKK